MSKPLEESLGLLSWITSIDWWKEKMTSYVWNVRPKITQVIDENDRALVNETWNITAF